MRYLLLFLFTLGVAFGQSKQDILNNLQREGAIDVVDTSPDSTSKFLIWDGDEIKLAAVQRVGANAFDTLSANIFKAGTAIAGQDTFTTTGTVDTLVVSGTDTTDYCFATGVGSSVDQQDVLQAVAGTDTIFVYRLASGASGLKYNWFRIKVK